MRMQIDIEDLQTIKKKNTIMKAIQSKITTQTEKIGQKIYMFDIDKYVITPEKLPTVINNAKIIKEVPYLEQKLKQRVIVI